MEKSITGKIIKLYKGDNPSQGLSAKILLANNTTMTLGVSLNHEVGDIIRVKKQVSGEYVVLEVDGHMQAKNFSPRYGYVEIQPSNKREAINIAEFKSSDITGNTTYGYTAASKEGAMIGYGMANYVFLDDAGYVKKAINSAEINGNKISGNNLSSGNGLSIYLDGVDDLKFMNADSEPILSSLNDNIDNNSFLLNLIGMSGILYAASGSVYKIEGSGTGTLSELLSLNKFPIKLGDETFNLESNFTNLLERLKNNLNIEHTVEFSMYLYEHSNKEKLDDSKQILIKFLGRNYIVSEVEAHSIDSTYHYANNITCETNTRAFIDTNFILDIKNLIINKGIFINPVSKQISINNDELTLNALKLKSNVTSSETLATDEIILKVGQKGLKIDLNGTANI